MNQIQQMMLDVLKDNLELYDNSPLDWFAWVTTWNALRISNNDIQNR